MSELNDDQYVTIINAGGQTDYLFGLVSGLAKIQNFKIEVVDSDYSEGLFDRFPNVAFYNLRGDQNSSSPFIYKMQRIVKYYLKLIAFAAKTNSKVFHIQWENKFILIDRFFLGAYYKMLRKKLVFTAHNIDTRAREGKSSLLNRLSLRFFYWIVDSIIVHTQRMKMELVTDFGVPKHKIKIIPHGINNKVAKTGISQKQARSELGIVGGAKVALFFGYLRPSKGLETLLQSLKELLENDPDYKLVVAGSAELYGDYLSNIKSYVSENGLTDHVLFENGFIEDSAVEKYFMAADCLILPYKTIFQTGVIFLSYRFGLPVIVTDVGQLKDEIVEGFTGLVCRPNDVEDMTQTIQSYFKSRLYGELDENREKIIKYAEGKYSWEEIAIITANACYVQ